MSKSIQTNEMKLKIIKEKYEQIPHLMKEFGIECWITFVRETVLNPDPIMNLIVGTDVVLQSAFIFGFENNDFKKIAIVANFDAKEQEKKGIWDHVIGYEQGLSKHLKATIKRLEPRNIALNYSLYDTTADGLTHGMFLVLEKILLNYKNHFMSAEKLIQVLRGRKTKTELELIQKACEITEEINKNITPHIKVGKNEIEIQQMFFNEMEKYGVIEAWQKLQCPMIDAGPEKEFGHISPLETSITKKGNTLHNDFGIRYQGYCSDLQRMWFFGKKEEVPEELRYAIETIGNAIQLAVESIKPGIRGYEIDQKVRNYIISRGHEEYKHALGHQVGLEAHDGGGLLGPLWERYGETPKQRIEKNQVYTLEPSVKTKSHGMVALEEMIVVTEEGCKYLVPPMKNLIHVF